MMTWRILSALAESKPTPVMTIEVLERVLDRCLDHGYTRADLLQLIRSYVARGWVREQRFQVPSIGSIIAYEITDCGRDALLKEVS